MNDSQTLQNFIRKKAPLCVHEAQGQLALRFVTPSYAVFPGSDDEAGVPLRSLTGHYLQMYDWDACFFSQTSKLIDMPNLGSEVVSNFLQLQEDDGYVPRTISPQRIWDKGDLCKPFLSQCLLAGTHEDSSGKSLTTMLPKLSKYLDYIWQKRSPEGGLCHWRNVLESGVDNNLSLLAPQEASRDENMLPGKFPDGLLVAVDLNAYLIAEVSAFGSLAKRCGMPDLAVSHQRKVEILRAQLEDQLWNESLGMYCNFNPESAEPIAIRSWTGLIPALFEACSVERIKEIIERNILSEEHFFRPCGLSSVAASEPLYNQAKRGLYGKNIVSNWQGPMWTLPNVLVTRCLYKYGYQKQAVELASRVVRTLANGIRQSGTLFENYHAENGQPLWAPQFMSWNVLAWELAELAA